MTPPLGLYVHWPYCERICPYCDFAVVRDRGRREDQARLVSAILRDVESQTEGLGDRRLVSIFFGGGTPSLMPPDAVAAVIDLARRRFSPSGPLEVSLEANPTDAEASRFEAFRAAGVTRLSLGVQSFDDAYLRFLHRNHDSAAALRAAALARRVFEHLSIDLIFAGPGQTRQALLADLQTAIDLGADHLSVYELTLEPGTPFERQARRGRFVPSEPAVCADLFELKDSYLREAGFDAYEVSNHARGADARCRHNRLYWRGEDYLGVGPSAHGRITTAQGRVATVAARSPAAYADLVTRTGLGTVERDVLSAEAAAEERLLMGLRCLDGVDRRDLEALPMSTLPDLLSEGWIEEVDGRLRATTAGRLVLNHIVARLVL